MKNGTLIINGKKYEIQMSEADVAEIEKPRTATGYERKEEGKEYFMAGYNNAVGLPEQDDEEDDRHYSVADYYADYNMACNIARADTLMRRLRQWQALNDKPVDWSDTDTGKYFIYYEYEAGVLSVMCNWTVRHIGETYFSTQMKAEEAVKEFEDELIWYFTEYRQRLDEPVRDNAE